MIELKPMDYIVATHLAYGIKLTEICRTHNLSYQSYLARKKQPRFQALIDEKLAKIEEELDTMHIEDPVMGLFKAQKMNAAKRLVDEMNSETDDSNSTSRQRAANSILDRIGYSSQKTEQIAPVVNIVISDKKHSIVSVKEQPLEKQPDVIEIR